MPVFGVGIIPGLGAEASQLSATVRRNFTPSVIVQFGKSSPMNSALLQSAKVATGGLSPITQPVQGVAMTATQPIGYDGSFAQPGMPPGIQNAEFNLKGYVTPIPFLGLEGLVQVDASIVPLIEARMNDATTTIINTFSTDLWNNFTATNRILSLLAAVDDGTFSPAYGNITRSSNTWFKSIYIHNASSTSLTRMLVLQYIAQQVKATGERPKMGVCNFGTWLNLASDIASLERYVITPERSFTLGAAETLFSAIDVGGVPIYPDPWIPEGTLVLLNTDYIHYFIHDRAAFYFTGFYNMIPNAQLGFMGLILVLIELVCVKPACQSKIDNLAAVGI